MENVENLWNMFDFEKEKVGKCWKPIDYVNYERKSLREEENRGKKKVYTKKKLTKFQNFLLSLIWLQKI